MQRTERGSSRARNLKRGKQKQLELLHQLTSLVAIVIEKEDHGIGNIQFDS